MHQPYYKDPLTGEISLPWVRLHGVKDYLAMVDLLKDFPRIRQTFNLVPSLIDQIEDYRAHEPPNEKFLALSLKPAAELTAEDKKFILLNFFMANWDYMVMPLPRYYDLLLKRGAFVSQAYIDRVMSAFTTQDYLDLQVLFNLCWFDPHVRSSDPALREITARGAQFTEEDKRIVIQKQLAILKRIIPAYKQLQDKGQIEVSVAPYYHPILPLLCDAAIAKAGMPRERMPQMKFAHPEDARWHIQHATRRYKEVFGRDPEGMWPSEGAVSEDILPLLIENGIRWIATDEEILLRSLHKPRAAEVIYKAYTLNRREGSVNIIFRDHNLSDAIGFLYQGAPAARAVEEFISHLHRIRTALASKEGAFIVPVILDGENAWEYYPNNGRDFLSLLYARLSEEEPLLTTTTVSKFLRDNPPEDDIASLYPGSWINANFSIWIGQEEKNLSWDLLSKTRDVLCAFQKGHPELAGTEKVRKAWEQIYIAEGSDWNWWYGPQNSSSCDEEFDRLYRKQLTNVYELLGMPPDDNLKIPIITREVKAIRGGRGFIKPKIDGLDTTYYEWLEAACFEVGTTGGTMHRAQSIIQRICCGFDLESLFIKIELRLPELCGIHTEDLKLVVLKMPSAEARIEIPLCDLQQIFTASLYKKPGGGAWKLAKEIREIAYKKILEMAVTFNDLEIKEGEAFKLAFFVEENGLTLERQPEAGPIRLARPTKDYEANNWSA